MRFNETAVVVVVDRGLQRDGCLAFDRAFHAPAAAMRIPNAVIKPELHFLFDITGKVVGRDPTGMDIESRIAPVGVFVNQAKLS